MATTHFFSLLSALLQPPSYLYDPSVVEPAGMFGEIYLALRNFIHKSARFSLGKKN